MRLIYLSIPFATVLVAALTGNLIAFADEKPSFVMVTPQEVSWKTVPFGNGAQVATIQGDPTQPGVYVQRVRFPPHTMSRPHWHPENRYVTVIKGTWYAGTGPVFDPAKATPLPAGSYMLHPAKEVHWDGAAGDEEVIVQVVGIGPSGTTTVDPKGPLFGEATK
jgi:quercetin dioxygenase-like cupin family protein